MPSGNSAKLIEQSEKGPPPFWAINSTTLIRKEYSEQSRNITCIPTTKTSSRPATPKTPRTSFHERSTPPSGRYSSRGLGLIMAFNNFQSSGGTAFGGGFQNSAGSNSQAQAQNGQVQAQNGPNLEDIQTEVCYAESIMRF